MQQRLLLAAVATLVLTSLVAAACTPADVSSPATSPATSAAPVSSAASGSPAASPSAAGSPSASPGASAVASPAAGNDLASLVPATINDVPVTVAQVEPEVFIGTSDRHRLQPLLQALGKSPSDIEAVAGGGGAGANSVIIEAVRIDGTDPSALMTQLQTALGQNPDSPVEATTVSGKDVLSTGGDRYVYVSDDVIFFISASNAEMAEATLTALP